MRKTTAPSLIIVNAQQKARHGSALNIRSHASKEPALCVILIELHNVRSVVIYSMVYTCVAIYTCVASLVCHPYGLCVP